MLRKSVPLPALAVFLDRDGVVNPLIYHEDAGIVDSPFTVKQFTVLPGVPAAIRRLNDLDLKVVLVSNQPGIAKGHFGVDALNAFTAKMVRALRRAGAHLDSIHYCLHHPQARLKRFRKTCDCRKPSPGMIFEAAKELGIDLRYSYMVGDGITDIEAGSRAGCKTVFIGRWKCELCQFIEPPGLRPTFYARDLTDAVNLIASDLERSRQASRS